MSRILLPAEPAGAAALPSEEFMRAAAEELRGLRGELLGLVPDVALVDGPADASGVRAVALAPTPTQRQAAATLLRRYRGWYERVRPFLDRPPAGRAGALDEAFEALASYFALRRVGSGIAHAVWRELFELESLELVAHQLELIEDAKECFALLDPRPRKRLEDLAIRFTPAGDGRYRVLAHSGLGEAEGEMALPFGEREVENFVLRHCDPLRGAVRGWAPPSLQPYADFGGRLFRALFDGRVRDLYLKHMAAVGAGDVGLRIRLHVSGVPRLAALPWEFLYDGVDFVALGGSVAIARHVNTDRSVQPLRVDGPLRVAVTVSSPAGVSPIDAAAEVAGLKRALAPLAAAGLVRVDVAPDGTITTLAQMLRAADAAGRPFHIWHFIGHGRHLEREAATYLTFESANGAPEMQSGFELGTLLSAHPAMRLAILNACEGARAAPEDSLTSVGAALVARGLPAAVAMQFSITDQAAIRFADDLYRGLAESDALETAVGDARRSIFFMPNASEWATPVILMRAREGVLFDVRRAR